MYDLPKKLNEKLSKRASIKALRNLAETNDLIDFSSNDYLGFSQNPKISEGATELVSKNGIAQNGATGSRLLSGNHKLYAKLEKDLASFHNSPSALVFNSGYDANIGFFSAVPQRGDIVFYDEYIHASIRDGIQMGHAKSYKFKHNDTEDLGRRCETERSRQNPETEIYIVTESVFSMDGDSPDLNAFVQISQANNGHLIVDEAHAVGVLGKMGEGLVQHLNLQDSIFARIVTFGKAVGCHGAAILGSLDLKNYMINFARSLIYTTALPPHSVATISVAYGKLATSQIALVRLKNNIDYFNTQLKALHLESFFIPSCSAIHCCVVSGNEKVRSMAEKLQQIGFDVWPILSPTVPKGQERLRICLHSFNSEEDIFDLLSAMNGLR